MADITFTFTGTIGDFERLTKGADIKQELQNIMATFAEMQTAFNGLKDTVTAEIEQINAKIADALAQSGTLEEREALLTDIQNETARIAGIVADAPTPEEPTPGE